MKKYDVLVIGAGAGLEVVSFAADKGMSVAIIEEGPLGGTCLNRGCIPSKILIHSADVVETIKNSEKFGVKSTIEKIDFASIVKRVNEIVDTDAGNIEKSIKESENPTLYKMHGKFIGPKQMQVGDPSAGSGQVEQIEAEKVFIVGGTRPTIPPIPGLETTPYLDSTKALRLEKQPEHLIVIGGGYIAAELAHFYGTLGTKITILVRGNHMLSDEDEEIADWFTKEFSNKYEILFNTQAESVSYQNDKFTITLKESEKKLESDQLLVVTGRVPNTDILDVKATGVAVDDKGYIKVNEYLETNVEGIWAFGDILGILPFRHTANDQAGISLRNAFTDKKVPFDPFAIGHAVFSSPQVAGVGKTEQQLKKEGITYKVGRAELKDTGMGGALQENGLVKVLADDTGQKILGVHIIGPQASILIHEAIVAMKSSSNVSAITNSVYIHPALPEWLQRAFFAIE
ncbi:MAG: dihydrolipoamide dehydrogenase [Candidatus Levybacteria bacterium CG22_combo_CG10-13_8_21_14_all_35_11]|nr:MAG: dihydrolipoamide dehydrogenase [Candidatus Levybacteria bacterium CG22_combo_CG10-13_8_21_14_all_35_11]